MQGITTACLKFRCTTSDSAGDNTDDTMTSVGGCGSPNGLDWSDNTYCAGSGVDGVHGGERVRLRDTIYERAREREFKREREREKE